MSEPYLPKGYSIRCETDQGWLWFNFFLGIVCAFGIIVLFFQTVGAIFSGYLRSGLLLGLMLALYILFSIQANNDGRMQKFVVSFKRDNVGMAKISRTKSYVLLNKLEIDVNHQRRGLGTALVKCVIAETDRPIYLVCTPNLETFYHRLGFTAVANRKLPFLMRSLGKSSSITMRYLALSE